MLYAVLLLNSFYIGGKSILCNLGNENATGNFYPIHPTEINL